MRFHILQHVPFEGPGIIADWAVLNGHSVSATQFFEEGYVIPELDAFDCLVVLGGPMGVYSEAEYPWLAEEKKLIGSVLEKDHKVVGICLGAQLVANVLGARVYRNQHKEIGWGPIWLTEAGAEAEILSHIPEELEVLHWHGDTFDIPKGAQNLAQSAGCRHQAFLFEDRVLGLQFHLEMTRHSLQSLVEACGHELSPDVYVQSGPKMLSRQRAFMRSNHALRGILLKIANR